MDHGAEAAVEEAEAGAAPATKKSQSGAAILSLSQSFHQTKRNNGMGFSMECHMPSPDAHLNLEEEFGSEFGDPNDDLDLDPELFPEEPLRDPVTPKGSVDHSIAGAWLTPQTPSTPSHSVSRATKATTPAYPRSRSGGRDRGHMHLASSSFMDGHLSTASSIHPPHPSQQSIHSLQSLSNLNSQSQLTQSQLTQQSLQSVLQESSTRTLSQERERLRTRDKQRSTQSALESMTKELTSMGFLKGHLKGQLRHSAHSSAQESALSMAHAKGFDQRPATALAPTSDGDPTSGGGRAPVTGPHICSDWTTRREQ